MLYVPHISLKLGKNKIGVQSRDIRSQKRHSKTTERDKTFFSRIQKKKNRRKK